MARGAKKLAAARKKPATAVTTRRSTDGSAGVGEPPLAPAALAQIPSCVIAKSTSIAALVPAPIHTASMVMARASPSWMALIYTTEVTPTTALRFDSRRRPGTPYPRAIEHISRRAGKLALPDPP